MSEEILKALMQLFAILTKQDGGVEELEKNYVRNFLVQQMGENNPDEYYRLFNETSNAEEDSGHEKGKDRDRGQKPQKRADRGKQQGKTDSPRERHEQKLSVALRGIGQTAPERCAEERDQRRCGGQETDFAAGQAQIAIK